MVEQVSDFKMPEKVVTRLLKDALPDNVVISKDARNAACRSASIFILQLSIAAAEKAHENKRRTLDNQDIIKAVMDLGLAEYTPQLVRFGAQRKRNAKRKESSMLMKAKPNKRAAVEDNQDTPEITNDRNTQEVEQDEQDPVTNPEEDESPPETVEE